MRGQVTGGQQPVSGASIYLYAAGTSGNGQGAVNLLRNAVLTDANGSFGLTGDYTCPSASTQVYLVSSGGNPGLATGTNNSAALMMAALGDCGNLTSSTFTNINEVTTVAAAYALNRFLGSSGNIGSSVTNATGLRNAFLVAGNLADTAQGSSPGPSLPATATVEKAKLYSLANVLSTCINSTGTALCTPLFTAATSGGVVPANTLDAARGDCAASRGERCIDLRGDRGFASVSARVDQGSERLDDVYYLQRRRNRHAHLDRIGFHGQPVGGELLRRRGKQAFGYGSAGLGDGVCR